MIGSRNSVVGERTRSICLAVLTLIFAFNYVERYAFSLLLQDIKTDLQLSDTQIGLLTGILFALFYSVMGIPLARWADRGNRKTIITVTTLLWSAALATCSLATNFIQLVVIRIGVGVGEAGIVPAAHSLIADYFDRNERPKAVATFMVGAPASVFGGYLVAGWLNDLFGWRSTLLLIGLPGIALALVASLLLREPRRETKLEDAEHSRSRVAVQRPSIERVPTGVLIATLWSNVTFRHLVIAFSVMYFFGFGVQQWKPAFFLRSYGLSTAELGTWLAFINGVSGVAGTWVGGQWATRFASNNERLQLKVTAVAYAAFGIISSLVYISPNYYAAFGFLALASFGAAAAVGPLFATMQTLVPPHMRALSIASVYLVANLIGMGFGPLAVGVLSDMTASVFGAQSLRISLLIMCPGYVWGGYHLWLATRTVERDMASAASADPA